MGEAISRDLVSKGWTVAMTDINENKSLAEELGSKARFYQSNVASYSSQAKMFDQVFKDFGRIDALCANAGIVDRQSLYQLGDVSEEIPPEPDLLCTDVDWKGGLEVWRRLSRSIELINDSGVVYGTYLATHFMRKNEKPGGVIVATASIAAVHPHPTYPEYNGAKAAVSWGLQDQKPPSLMEMQVLNWVRGTAGVLKSKHNIRINAVLPGIVRTNIIPPEMVAAVKEE